MNETTLTKTLSGYLIDTEIGISGPVTTEMELEAYYQLLHCDLITITYLPINGKEYCIIADDEGLFKRNNKISAADIHDLKPLLVGSLLITSAEDPDDTGDFCSLSDDDICSIRERVIDVIHPDGTYPLVLIG